MPEAELSLPKFELAARKTEHREERAYNRTSAGGVADVIVNTRSNVRPCMMCSLPTGWAFEILLACGQHVWVAA